MLDRLRELKRELSEYEYVLLLNIIFQNIKYHYNIGTRYTEATLIELVNNSLEVIKRL